MIRLKNLSMKNFFSHVNTQIDISSKRGLVLIDGKNEDGRYDSNGSGKSTILEGIVYALSGNTLRSVGVNDVVNRKVGKDTEVRLSFAADKNYDIVRYRKHTVNGDKLDILEEGSSIAKRLNKDTQVLLDSLVDIPYDVLVNTMLLGEGLSSRFTQLSDPDKKSLIESTLHLSYDLSKSKDIASSKLKSLKLEKATCEGQLSTIESILSSDLKDVEETLNKSEFFLDENKGRLESLHTRIAEGITHRDNIHKKISVLQNSMKKFQETTYALSVLDGETSHYIEELSRVVREEHPICSLCKQLLETPDARESVTQNFQDLVDKNNSRMGELRAELQEIPEYNLLEEKEKELITEFSEVSSLVETLSREYQELHLLLNSAERDVFNAKNILENYEGYKQKSEELKENIRVFSGSIADYEYLYKLYSPTGIMVYVLEEAISYINTRIKVYTDVLLDKSYSLSLEKGKIVLKDKDGSSYQSLSNGEKRRLDICIQFSLHDYTHIYCGNSCNVLFCDEVLDTLDATGVTNIIELLSMKREYCNLDCIFIISHNSALKSYFDEVITVVKDREGNSYTNDR